MRKIVIAAAGVALLATAAWSGVWYAGRGEIESRVAEEAERLRKAGYEVDYTGGAVGGYPLAWEARYTDVRVADPEGRVVELPWLVARAGVEDPGRVAFRFPEAFSATLPLPPEVAEGHEDAPETLLVEVEAEDLTVRTTPPGGASTALDATAASLLVVSAGETQPLSGAVEISRLDAGLTWPGADSAGRATGRASAARIDYAITQLDPNGMRTTSEGISDRVSLTGESEILSMEDLQRFLRGEERDRSVELSWTAGDTVSQVKVDGSEGTLDGKMRQTAATTAGIFRVSDGQIEVRASADGNLIALEPVDEAAPVRGQITLGSLETVYLAPIVPSQEMSPFNIRIAARGLEIEESLWALVDPGETLERGRADLVLEVAGTGRLVEPAEGEPKPTGSDAIELGNVEIAVAEISALGASLEAGGAIEFLQPLNQPNGRITVKTRNLVDLAQRLQALGLIDEQTFQMASLMATIYTRAGETEDERVSEIVFADSGITINDLPVR